MSLVASLHPRVGRRAVGSTATDTVTWGPEQVHAPVDEAEVEAELMRGRNIPTQCGAMGTPQPTGKENGVDDVNINFV
jgi:hypothetical protein